MINKIYKELIEKILNEGQMQKGEVRTKYADGTPAYTMYLPNAVTITFKKEWGLPLISTKTVSTRVPLVELDWIWRECSNDVTYLQERNCKIWNEWADDNNTIGKAYGYQMAKKCRKGMNQVVYILHELKNNKRSRRIITNLYDVDDLDEMTLEPCVFMTNWQVDEDNKLHLNVIQRSADVALGLPYNLYQYGVLHRRISQVLGYDLGDMAWTMFNAHAYDRHIDLLKEQISQEINHEPIEVELPEDLDFFKVPLWECKVKNYRPIESDKPLKDRKFKYEVAI